MIHLPYGHLPYAKSTSSESLTLITITNTLVMIIHSNNELDYLVTTVYLEHVVYIRYGTKTTCSR